MKIKSIKDKKILLIGGAGFIGHNLALFLKGFGADVSIIDSLGINNIIPFYSDEKPIPNRNLYLNMLQERQKLIRASNIPIYIQDARDYHALSGLFNRIKPQIVIMLAAVSHANQANKDPYTTFDHSMRTLENALDCSRKVGPTGNTRAHPVEHFIFFSSSMVYGNFKTKTVDEKTACDPLGIYAALKYAGEKLVIGYGQACDVPYTIVRPSALYGERCVSRRVGQIFIENALTTKQIELSGDGKDMLDFTYIGDLVSGIKNVIENENSLNQIFNITYGNGRSLNDLTEMVKEYFPEIQVQHKPKDKLTPNRGTLSIEKAKKLIGYCPDFPLEKGYLKYIMWYKEFYANTEARDHD